MPNIKLTPEQKAEKIAQKKERLKLQLAKITSLEKREERKERARELIRIGALLCQYHDRKKLLEYLENPKKFVVKSLEDNKFSLTNTKPTNGEKYTVFLDFL